MIPPFLGRDLFSQEKHLDRIAHMRKFILIFISYFILGHHDSVIAGDTLKEKYPIDDPRNPNCPCYSYQKLAEKEFHKWKTNENIGMNVKEGTQFRKTGKQIKSSFFLTFRFQFPAKKQGASAKKKNKIGHLYKRIRRKDISACYKKFG